MYKIEYIWDKGTRNVNQDSLVFFSGEINSKEFVLAIVADGVGGMKEGENASTFMVNYIYNAFVLFIENGNRITRGSLKKFFIRELKRCDGIIKQYGNEKSINLGCAFTCICLFGRTCLVFSLGDTGLLVNKKLMTPVQRDNKGRLTACLGAGSMTLLYYKCIKIVSSDEIIICSDGYRENKEDNKTAIIINSTKKENNWLRLFN